MQHQSGIVTIFFAIFVIAHSSSSPIPSSEIIQMVCEPDYLEKIPQCIKKFCISLEDTNQLSSTQNQFSRNLAEGESCKYSWASYSICNTKKVI